MSEKNPELEAELIVNAINIAFGDKFIKLQEQVIQIGNHVLKLQKRLDELESKPTLRIVK